MGRIALVTGSSKGVGRGIACGLADDGWDVAVNYNSDEAGARETAAIVATARWCNAAALARHESRGMHLRADAPKPLPELASRLLTGGTDALWTRFETDLQAGAAA